MTVLNATRLKNVRFESAFWGLAIVLLVSSVALNLVQAHRIEALLLASATKPFRSGVAPAIMLRGTDNSDLELKLSGRSGDLPVLLYWFSPTCAWCRANMANFKALVDQSTGRFHLIAVSGASLDDLSAYREQFHLSITLYHIDAEPTRQYRLSGTPETVLITPKGALMKRWSGAYNPGMLTQIERALSITLPGLSSGKMLSE